MTLGRAAVLGGELRGPLTECRAAAGAGRTANVLQAPRAALAGARARPTSLYFRPRVSTHYFAYLTGPAAYRN